MPEINVLIAGEGISVPDIKNSKYLKKLYVTGKEEVDGALLIKFNTFKELAQKCKSLQIDIVIVENEKWILQGIADVLKSEFINCIAPTSQWTNLSLSSLYARDLAQRYGINVPKIIRLPVDFPIIMKANGLTRKANNLQELIDLRNEININYPQISESIFLERYIEGKNITVTSLFDGKHLITFPDKNIENGMLAEYSKMLENLFIGENASFTGFINSKLIYTEEKIYNVGFSFEYLKPTCDCDLLYILLSSVYQKLNEVSLLN